MTAIIIVIFSIIFNRIISHLSVTWPLSICSCLDSLGWKTSSYQETAQRPMTSTWIRAMIGQCTSTRGFCSSSTWPLWLSSRQDFMQHLTRFDRHLAWSDCLSSNDTDCTEKTNKLCFIVCKNPHQRSRIYWNLFLCWLWAATWGPSAIKWGDGGVKNVESSQWR